MKNTTELRKELSKVFDDLKQRKIDVASTKAFVATSNAIIKSAAIEAEYNKFLGKKNKIDFLSTPINEK